MRLGDADDRADHRRNRRPPRTRAEATITVQDSTAEPFDQAAGPTLMEVRIRETFSGDIEGDSTVRALQMLRKDRSACMVSLQRVRARLGGRQGTFVLQGAETVADGEIKATWSVVPGSGTGELEGLRGEGGFEGRSEKGLAGRWTTGSSDRRHSRGWFRR